MKTAMQEYITFMENYCDIYDELVAIWQEKQRIILNNDLYLLEEQVKKEEVGVLKAKGLEEKRLKLQKKLGLEDKKLQELINEVEHREQQEQLRAIKRRLSGSVQLLMSLNDSCKTLTEDRFATIEREMARIQQKKGNSQAKPKNFINRSI